MIEAGEVVSGARRRSHAAIRADARRAATGLAASGVRPGDAVALLLRNDFPFFEASLALRRLGARAVPLNWHAGADGIAAILADCGARLAIAHADLAALLPPELPRILAATPPELRAAFALAAAPPPAARPEPEWRDWLAGFPEREEAEPPAPPLLYTSGSTGPPKPIRRRSASSGSQRALPVYGLDDPAPMRALIAGPMCHSIANAYGRLAFAAGAAIVLLPRFEPAALLAAVERHAITHALLTPAMMLRLVRLPGRGRFDVASLRFVAHGAAPCAPPIKAAMLDWLGPVVHEFYGSTETGLLTAIGPAEARAKPGSVGRALADVRLEIRDGEGRALPPGAVGEVFAVAPATGGGAVAPGDLGSLDADGYLTLRGRRSEMRDGVHPAAVEAALIAHPGVADCAVLALEGGFAACIEPLPGVDPERLRAELAPLSPVRLARILVAALPREDTGKLGRPALRRLLDAEVRGANFPGAGAQGNSADRPLCRASRPVLRSS